LMGLEDLRFAELRDFFVLRLAMARDCTLVVRGIGSRTVFFDCIGVGEGL
jgi:hypothetical protein